MPVYDIGKVIRMKRESLEISRERLCELTGEACTEQTLYRIESGISKVKQSTYVAIMKAMGEPVERQFNRIKLKNAKYLNLSNEITVLISKKEYHNANGILSELAEQMDKEYPRNRQYIKRRKALIDYREGILSQEEYEKWLWDALKITIPNLYRIKMNHWPYMEEEILILMDLAMLYQEMKKPEESLKLLKNLKEALEQNYLDEGISATKLNWIRYTTANIYGNMGLHMEAVRQSEEGLASQKERKNIALAACFHYDILWNKEQLIEKGILPEQEKTFCVKELEEVYYLSIASGDKYIEEFCKKHMKEIYQDKITLL